MMSQVSASQLFMLLQYLKLPLMLFMWLTHGQQEPLCPQSPVIPLYHMFMFPEGA